MVAWRQSKWQINLAAFQHLSCHEWLEVLFNPKNCFPILDDQKVEMLLFAALTFDMVWMHQNIAAKGGALPYIIQLGTNINRITHQHWMTIKHRWKQKISRTPPVTWQSPPPGFLKINVDAAFSDTFAVSAFVVSGGHSQITHAWTGCSITSTAFQAEAEAAYQAMSWAQDRRLEFVIFEGDACGVIQSLNGSDQLIEWQGKHLILFGRNLLNSHASWSFAHIPRSCNFIAHNTA